LTPTAQPIRNVKIGDGVKGERLLILGLASALVQLQLRIAASRQQCKPLSCRVACFG
jgi:hypothetical protein